MDGQADWQTHRHIYIHTPFSDASAGQAVKRDGNMMKWSADGFLIYMIL